MDCSPPGSSVRGILQVRTLQWVATSFSTFALTVDKLNLEVPQPHPHKSWTWLVVFLFVCFSSGVSRPRDVLIGAGRLAPDDEGLVILTWLVTPNVFQMLNNPCLLCVCVCFNLIHPLENKKVYGCRSHFCGVRFLKSSVGWDLGTLQRCVGAFWLFSGQGAVELGKGISGQIRREISMCDY